MPTWIALFRGINVGGRNKLPMAELRSGLESLKLKNVRTYIQSGNVVFESPAKNAASLAKRIANYVEQRYEFRPGLVLLQQRDLITAINNNPFPDATANPKSLHFFFLAEQAANADLKKIEAIKGVTESYKLTDSIFYLHTPDGMARSKLGARAPAYLGVIATARNYRTVEKVLAMAE